MFNFSRCLAKRKEKKQLQRLQGELIFLKLCQNVPNKKRTNFTKDGCDSSSRFRVTVDNLIVDPKPP